VKLYLLSGGTIDADRAVIHPGDSSRRRVTIPCYQVLVENDGLWVLVDTGMPVSAAGNPDGMRQYGWEPTWLRPHTAADERVDAQLAKLGLQPGDLHLVVCTHFHSDHAGGNALFTDVAIAAQEEELIAARDSDDYPPVWDAPGIQFQPVRGDWSPLPGFHMLSTPGHTPGHQSMLVRLGSENWLFTWDAVYTEEHWRGNKLGAVRDVSGARASLKRLKSVARAENARIVFGHDIAQWGALGMTDRREPRLIASDE
jgi:N-acyl homoserine lactone hydrolase